MSDNCAWSCRLIAGRPPGTLRLEATICYYISESFFANYKHVASPGVHVDHEPLALSLCLIGQEL